MDAFETTWTVIMTLLVVAAVTGAVYAIVYDQTHNCVEYNTRCGYEQMLGKSMHFVQTSCDDLRSTRVVHECTKYEQNGG